MKKYYICPSTDNLVLEKPIMEGATDVGSSGVTDGNEGYSGVSPRMLYI